MLGGLADIRETIRRFNDLSRPAVRNLDASKHRQQRALQTIEAGAGVGHLTGLVIFAAEDHEIVIVVRFDS